MKKLLYFMLLYSVCLQANIDLEQLYNKAFLKNISLVQDLLTKHNFKKVYFTTQDKIKICGLFLDKSNKNKQPILGTIIFESGFYPGAKEGIATFYAMLQDEPYNFLFLDARGHFESEGALLSYQGIKNYGKYDYLDTLAAIDFVTHYNQKHNICSHIILYGLCSGAFHHTRALIKQKEQPHVKGLIFDSGWNQLTEIGQKVIPAELDKKFYNSYLSWIIKPISSLMTYLYNLCFYDAHKEIDTLEQDIACLTCPIFFIHSLHDTYAPITSIQNLATKAKQSETWWINGQSHGVCHLDNQKEYQKRLQQFCKKTLTSSF